MTIYEAIQNRHAVRSYEEKELEKSAAAALAEEIRRCNQEGELAIQLITKDPGVFQGLMARAVGFRGVSNYIALVGPSGDKLAEKLGYYGERIALKAQQLGLNTCWAAATYKKGKCRAVVKDNQECICLIAVGYGTTQGVPHKSKPMEQLCQADQEMPEWFQRGVEAAMLAPTAMNKQNFRIVLMEKKISFEEVKESKYGKLDLGIVKYHFQIGADLSKKEKTPSFL